MPATNPIDTRGVSLGHAPAGLAPWREWVESALRRIASAVGMRIQVEGARRSLIHADGGVSFEGITLGGTDGTATHNWTPATIDGTHISVSAGSVNGITATGGDSVLVDDVDLNYVYAKVGITLDIDGDGYVLGGTTDSVVIESATTEPTSSRFHRYFILLTWQAGVLVSQLHYWNIGFAMRDDGSSTSTAEYPDWVGA